MNVWTLSNSWISQNHFFFNFISTFRILLFFGLFPFSVTSTNIVAVSSKLRATAKKEKTRKERNQKEKSKEQKIRKKTENFISFFLLKNQKAILPKLSFSFNIFQISLSISSGSSWLRETAHHKLQPPRPERQMPKTNKPKTI